jgi:hypothetical protein
MQATTARTKPKTYRQIFMARTGSMYSGMVSRFSEKRNKLNRITRVGRKVPFTLEDLRAHLLAFLGGREDGTARCKYCGVQLTASSVAADHAIPVNRGGSLALENIEFPCMPCNHTQGPAASGGVLGAVQGARSVADRRAPGRAVEA